MCDFNIKKELIKTIELINDSFIKENIKIKLLKADDYHLTGYANELSHCFLIILQNAKDALIDSTLEDKTIEISLYTNNKNCILDISNNGKMIEKNIEHKIFDPYFSTKNEKNGTGIGLYMTKTIIKKHFNGSIEVFNTPKKVTFQIRL